MPDLLLAPYLALREPARVGPWDLIPFARLDASLAVPSDLRDHVLRLVDAYRLPKGDALGAVIHPAAEGVGAPFDRATMATVGNALLAGTIADNPALALGDEDRANAGHSIATSENALLYGHPLKDPGWYAIQRGMLYRELSGRFADEPDGPLPKVEAPVELPKPFLGSFDAEVANAAHAALDASDVSARRLQRALDWYVVAFSNAEAVTLDVRVGAARSALEVLAGSGDKTRRLVRAVGRLLREGDAKKRTRESRFWKGPVQLTDDEWWTTRLCELRNTIVHGDEVPDALWTHEGHHQLNLIHDNLIRCLKATVAAHAGDPLLKLTRSDRSIPRATERLMERVRANKSEAAEGRCSPCEGARPAWSAVGR